MSNYISKSLKEIESEICKAAKCEKWFTELDEYKTELESDCIKFFLTGLRWKWENQLA